MTTSGDIVEYLPTRPHFRHENCVHPIGYRLSTGEVLIGRCQSTNETYCPPCARSYRRRCRQVAKSGVEGAIAEGLVLALLTLTAPSHIKRHRREDGSWCPCTPPGGIDIGTWNGMAGEGWNDLVTDLRRTFGIDLQYFRGVEVQERGALHYHVIIRIPHGGTIPTAEQIQSLAIRHGFGHEVRFDVIDHTRPNTSTHYVTKYVTKASSLRRAVPFVHRLTGEVAPGRWRTWTASRRWGDSMAMVKAAQADWARRQRLGITADDCSPPASDGLLATALAGALDLFNPLSYATDDG